VEISLPRIGWRPIESSGHRHLDPTLNRIAASGAAAAMSAACVGGGVGLAVGATIEIAGVAAAAAGVVVAVVKTAQKASWGRKVCHNRIQTQGAALFALGDCGYVRMGTDWRLEVRQGWLKLQSKICRTALSGCDYYSRIWNGKDSGMMYPQA
jgi:hypothetical protein